MCKINGNGTTLENIHRAAKAEFLEKGYKDASLRNIVKSVGMTTGAFYGYYKSKEELFEAIVGEHYEYIRNRFIKAQQEFANGQIPEWPKGTDCKSAATCFGGSNPPLPILLFRR